MVFDSVEFFLFLPIVFIVYWKSRSLVSRNLLLLAASYFFYGYWDYRFLALIVVSSAVDFVVGLKIANTSQARPRRFWLATSLIVNLGILGFFKYFNFFIDSANSLLMSVGLDSQLYSLQIILPVGISFYTFQTLSYTIDVYRGEIEAERDWLKFFTFVSFFPQLVAGPIERASNLLPQFHDVKEFRYIEVVEGLRQILWGLFKKVAIADRCAFIVNHAFEHDEKLSWYFLAFGVVAFAFQIYCDFSGYSDIAIGTAKLFGFKLMANFRYPYFSRDIAEFWRRWHISLSSWFRDYVYIPLGGSRTSLARAVVNIWIVFLLSGLWHGAKWTFVVWGALHAAYFLPLFFLKQNRVNSAKEVVGLSWTLIPKILLTFFLVCIGWVFFRANDLPSALGYFSNVLSFRMALPSLDLVAQSILVSLMLGLLLVMDWTWQNQDYPFQNSSGRSWVRWSYYVLVGTAVFANGSSENTFIYFQF